MTKALTLALEIGNPPQLWKTYQTLGELHERKAERAQPRAAYASALEVIEQTAQRLQDESIRRTFLSAQPVQRLRQCLERLSENTPERENAPGGPDRNN
ncbi:MAG: hypothetical protein HYY23_02630 [Verrucomicrobia bacterium]|nr:hypothetical protein [Verrucomicrobiota bacterium]